MGGETLRLSAPSPNITSMKILNTISSLRKKKYVSIPLRVVSIFLQCIGVIALIGIFYYQQKPKDTMFGSYQYSYELSEKSALDTWEKDSNFFQRKNFGEFRILLEQSPEDGTDKIVTTHPVSGEDVGGYLYINGKKYSARLNFSTGEVSYDNSQSYERKNWQWYHWMGIR